MKSLLSIDCAEIEEDYLCAYPSYSRPYCLMLACFEAGRESSVFLDAKRVKRLRKYLKRWLESLEEGE